MIAGCAKKVKQFFLEKKGIYFILRRLKVEKKTITIGCMTYDDKDSVPNISITPQLNVVYKTIFMFSSGTKWEKPLTLRQNDSTFMI